MRKDPLQRALSWIKLGSSPRLIDFITHTHLWPRAGCQHLLAYVPAVPGAYRKSAGRLRCSNVGYRFEASFISCGELR